MAQYNIKLSTGSDFSQEFVLKDSSGNLRDLTGIEANFYIYKPDGTTSALVISTTNGKIINGNTDGTLTVLFTPADIALIDGQFYKLEIVELDLTQIEVATGNLFVLRENRPYLERLIPDLRLKIGDTDPTAYRYLDEWLLRALILGFKKSQKYFDFKYLIDENNDISRNPNYRYFNFAEPPVVEPADEYILVLFAALLTLDGKLEASAWDAVSWKDAEISYSNLESFRTRNEILKRLLDEIHEVITSPNKRLAQAVKQSLPGYLNNQWERSTKY